MNMTMTLQGIEHDHASIIMERYGIGQMTMWRWVKKGLLPKPVKLGRNRYFPRDAVDASLAKGE